MGLRCVVYELDVADKERDCCLPSHHTISDQGPRMSHATKSCETPKEIRMQNN
jgi:hypothetical protein